MLITYLRSSSYGSWDMCPIKYYLSYVLGIKEEPNQKTVKGSICHKALELLARKKLAEQNGEETFLDEEIQDEPFLANQINFDKAMSIAWNHYTDDTFVWTEVDYRDCHKWTQNVIDYNNGMFSPTKRTIVKPEQFFDFEIDEPWAEYDYEINGVKIKGKLAIKGTMDLLVKDDDGSLELLDWKTGARLDWATGEEKDIHKIYEDFQLQLYYYALTRIYPEINDITVTIFFLKSGGPFSLMFCRDDLPKILEKIKQRFFEIKNCHLPKPIYPGQMRMSFGGYMSKCEKFCYFRKIKKDGTEALDYSESICNTISNDLIQLGIRRVTEENIILDNLTKYTGGGRDNVETKKEK